MEVKDILKIKRQESGLTQEQLGFKLGLDRSTISRIETGKALPTDEQTTLICQYFNLDLDDYLSQRTESSGSNKPYFSNRDIYNYIILLMCAILAFFLNPWGIPFGLYALYFSFKNRMPWFFKLFSILVLLYCLYEILFFFGIYLIKPKIIID